MGVTHMNISIGRQLLPGVARAFQKTYKFTSFASNSNSLPLIASLRIRTYFSSTPSDSDTSNLAEFADEFEIDESTNIYSTLDVGAITDNDPEKINNLKLLLMKLDMMSKRGGHLPSNLSTEKWREILLLPSISQRLKYLKYLYTIEAMKEEKKILKQEKRSVYEKFLEEKTLQPKPTLTTSSPPKYGLGETTIFHRIRNSYIDSFYNYKLLDPLMYGPDIIFDCDFEKFMTRRETGSAAKQIGNAWRLNRLDLKPFNVVFCNLDKNRYMYSKLKQRFPSLEKPSVPFNITDENFLELYSKDELVYLSPHAIDTLEYYDTSKTYIIGVMVDLVMPEPLSLAKAKKYGIPAKKFPLDKYVRWKAGGKSLHMDHCIKIMLDLKNGLDWKTILLTHVPPRKLADQQPETELEEDSKRSAKQIRRMYLKNKVHEFIVDEKQSY